MSLERFAGIPEFIATAQTGSFTAAGSALGLTKSAVSKTVARLEARLGARLLYRTTRRLSLTSDGEAFLAACSIASEGFVEFEEMLDAGRKRPAGRVKIDLPGAFGRIYIVPVLVELMARFPDLALTVSFTDRRVDLIEEGIDISVRVGPPPDSPDLMAREIGSQRLITCASPDYLARHGTPLRPDDLASHRLIVGRRNRTRHAWLFRSPDGSTERLPVTGYHELADGDAMLSAAVAGLGVAQLPTWLAGDYFASGKLVPILEEASGAEVPISLIWVSGGNLPLRMRAVIDGIAEKASRWGSEIDPIPLGP